MTAKQKSKHMRLISGHDISTDSTLFRADMLLPTISANIATFNKHICVQLQWRLLQNSKHLRHYQTLEHKLKQMVNKLWRVAEKTSPRAVRLGIIGQLDVPKYAQIWEVK